MSYIESEKISIFPFSKTRKNNDDRLFYENNVANLIRQLIDTEGFIIHAPDILYIENSSVQLPGDDYLEFNIYGYNIKIKPDTPLVSGNITDGIYAKITIKDSEKDNNGNDVPIPPEISGQDNNNNVFEGLEILTAKPINPAANSHILKLYDNNKGELKLCEDSLIKFELPRIKITCIDGKHQ